MQPCGVENPDWEVIFASTVKRPFPHNPRSILSSDTAVLSEGKLPAGQTSSSGLQGEGLMMGARWLERAGSTVGHERGGLR